MFVRHAERGKQLAVGCVHAGIGFFDLCLCSSQLRFIRRTFDQHIVVLLVDSVQVLLPSLRFYIVRISIRVLAQSFCAALDGVRFKINIISQTGHQRRQTGKGIVILSVPGSIAVGGSFDGLQLADVLVRDTGSGFHVGQR